MAKSEQEVVIRAKGIKKDFILPHEKNTSVKSTIVNVFRHSKKGATMQHALRGVSFDIKKGEFFGILGRNGSGKSTLLKILAEIYQPTEGTVGIKGKLVPFIELGVGFNPELTGRENVFLNGALLGFSRAEINARYDEIVKFAELEDFMDQKLKNYSSGMQVRLAFSVATRAEADILLVDEVLAVGDADFQRKCYDFFKSLKKSGKTVVFVTHDMSAVREYCDRAILIKDGVVAHEGKASGVADEYLKLFNKSELTKSVFAPEDRRWGNGQVVMHNVVLSKDKGIYKLSVDLQADKRGAEGCVLGFRFVNSDDKVLAGGNSLGSKGGRKINLMPRESRRVEIDFPDLFGSSVLSLCVTVRLSDGVTICDNWENITTITTPRKDPDYPVVLKGSMEIKEGAQR